MSWPEITGSFEFPKDEWYGLRARIRKASVSIPTNIAEGSAHRSTREYLNFLNIARASGAEVAYLVQLTYALEILSKSSFAILDQMCQQFVPHSRDWWTAWSSYGLKSEEPGARRLPAFARAARGQLEPRAQRLKPEAKDGHDPANDSGTSLFALPRW
jgi:four helix bundle protein